MGHWAHHLWFTWFWPSDKGNGPENIQWSVVVALAVAVLWPPVLRRIHRFVDRKADNLKAHVTAEHARIHERIDGLHATLHAHHQEQMAHHEKEKP